MPRRRRTLLTPEPLEVLPSFLSASDHPSVSLAPMDVRLYYFLLSRAVAYGTEVRSEFTEEDLAGYFELSLNDLRAPINALKKQGWVREEDGHYVLGALQDESIFVPFTEKPEEEYARYDLSTFNWDEFIPFCEQLSNYCESYGDRKETYMSTYGRLISEIRNKITATKPMTLALSSRVFNDTFFICYGRPFRPITREEGFVFTNLWKRYKNVALVSAIIMEFIMNFHRYRKDGVPSPKVLSFMADDVHAKVTQLNKNKQHHEEKTRRTSRSRKSRAEF